MRKTIVMMLTLVCNLTVRAQQAETIESFIANSHEPEWYMAQAEAWQKKVDGETCSEPLVITTSLLADGGRIKMNPERPISSARWRLRCPTVMC